MYLDPGSIVAFDYQGAGVSLRQVVGSRDRSHPNFVTLVAVRRNGGNAENPIRRGGHSSMRLKRSYTTMFATFDLEAKAL